MTVSLKNDWVWDCWAAQDGENIHLFHLTAPKSLENPDFRHRNARIGHSVSTDWINWDFVGDALTPGEDGAFDDLATWTGSVLKHDGVWHMFYTGVEKRSMTKAQRIGHAVSDDLMTWTRVSTTPIVEADPRLYATEAVDPNAEEPFRDPWVFFREEDNLWHMLITAREASSQPLADGTIAHATSPDLYTWTLQEPLCANSGIAQTEVLQVLQVDGKWVVIFCSAAQDIRRDSIPAAYATYSAPADGPLGPFHLDQAEPINEGGGIYAGRIVETSPGHYALIGFVDNGEPGGFTGTICDPLPVTLSSRGTLRG